MNEKLQPPQVVTSLDRDSASKMVELDESVKAGVAQQIEKFLQSVTLNPEHSDSFSESARTIHTLGAKEIEESSKIAGRMLARPMSAMSSGLFNNESPVSQALLSLRKTVEDLDPSTQGDLLGARKILGLIPYGSKIKSYFRKYQSAQTHIDAIINSLNHGKDELLKDNAAIEEEKHTLWNAIHALEKHISWGTQLDEQLVQRLADIETHDAKKAEAIKKDILFYVRQRVIDLKTQLAVSVQGYLAFDMIRKNNLELVKGIDRSTTTTISALRVAVTVAQALANERLVLNQINALNDTTGNIILTTSKILKEQATDIHGQAANATIGLDKLKEAFTNIYATFDMLDTYKLAALKNMQETTQELTKEIGKSAAYLKKVARPDELL